MVTTGIKITEIRINGKLFNETEEAFEFWSGQQQGQVETDVTRWGKRIFSRFVHEILAEKRSQE